MVPSDTTTASSGPESRSRAARLQGRLDRIAGWVERPRHEWLLFATLLGLLLLVQAVRPLYLNYDGSYSMLWGQEIWRGQLPDYNVYLRPTPHPLTSVYSGLVSGLGYTGIMLILIASAVFYAAFIAAAYKLVQLKLGTLVALTAAVMLLTRTDIISYALRGIHDMPFLALVMWAAVLEVRRPRRGVAPLVLLALAGWLRPETWLLAALYWCWLAVGWVRPTLSLPGRTPTLKALVGFAGLASLGPAVWLGFDYAVTGDALYSIHSTSKVAGELGRQRSLPEALWLLPRFVGGTERFVNTLSGTAGMLLAVYLLRQRAAMLVALGLVGIGTFLLIALAGLSVIPRYLLVPSVIATIGVGIALAGWTHVAAGRARTVALAVAGLTLILIGVRGYDYYKDFATLNSRTIALSHSQSALRKIIANPAVEHAMRTCRPLITPNHEAIPVLRYHLGLPKQQFRAAETYVSSRPTRGTLLLPASTLRPFELLLSTKKQGKSWDNVPQPEFDYVAQNRNFIVYSSCGGERG